MSRLAIGDRILVKAHGVGLEFADAPGVTTKNLSPRLAAAMEPRVRGDALEIPVAAVIPPELMGAGTGLSSDAGVLQIQTGDEALLEAHGLARLRLGDIVAVQDCDSTINSGYHKGAVSIGVVSEGDSYRAGFGPGLTILLTSRSGSLRPIVRPDTNLTSLLGLEF